MTPDNVDATQTSLRCYPRDFWMGCMLLFLVELGCALLGAPSPRLLEKAVCQHHFTKTQPGWVGDPTEKECKFHEVQVQLGVLLTVLSTCSLLAATIMQIPMGIIADKKGRRVALVLNIVSTILYWGSVCVFGSIKSLPLWTLYLPPMFVLIGGGPWATGALIFATVSSAVPAEQRTTAFSIMQAIAGSADLVGPLLATFTMAYGIWIPFALATMCFGMMILPAMLLADYPSQPEETTAPTVDGTERQPLLASNPGQDEESNQSHLQSGKAVLAVCFGSFFLLYLARDSTNYIIPWVSLRFHQSMAHTGLIFSLRAVVTSVLYLVLLPLTSTWLLQRWKGDASTADLALSTGSVLLSAIGGFSVALAPSIPALIVGFTIMFLGSGVIVTLRSFVASKVDPTFSGRLFAGISTIESIGGVIGTPIMGAAYTWGISHETWTVGLPFLVSGVSYLLIAVMLIYFQRWNQ